MNHLHTMIERILVWVLYATPLLMLSASALATGESDPFADSATQVDSWLTGGYGKLICLSATGIGMGVSAVTKSMLPTLNGLGITVGALVARKVILSQFS